MLGESLSAWKSAMELAGVKVSEWEALVQAIEGLFCLGLVLQLIQRSQDQLSDLLKCVIRNLYAKLDYNNDILVEETKYVRDILITVYVSIWRQ